MLLIFDREIKISPILIQDIWFYTTTGNTEYKGSLSLFLKDQILSLKITRNSLSLIPYRICTADLGSPKYQSEHTYPWLKIWIKPSLHKQKWKRNFHTHPHGNPWQLLFRKGFEVWPDEVFNSHSSQSIYAGGHCTAEHKIYTFFS